MLRDTLSLAEARRIALAAQRFHLPRPTARPGLAEVRATLNGLGLIQIDHVNLVVPAHYQVPFSRLGPYPRRLLDTLVYRRREFTEQWAHEASILPMAHWPLLRHRMDTRRVRPYGFERFLRRHPAYLAEILESVRTRGPLTAGDLPAPPGGERRLAHSWYGTVPRAVLEAYFARGTLAVADRRPNFARVFDLAERIVPEAHRRRRLEPAEAERELLHLAARAHGVGTAADLADHYRMSVREARPRLHELVESGVLRRVRVEEWREPAYLHREALLPARVEATALLSPFDPVLWFRPRAERLFDFHHRNEIFTPPAQRRWGACVLPFLLGERLVARVDLKALRPERRLRVGAAFLEPGVRPGPVAEALAAELGLLARWLELDALEVGRRGNLARTLASAVRRLSR
ncbi:MAG TPA: crosslink repair DNA glycosylase YcaQ family protein [Myxococcaceae bacterium]|nr:crosslink repair DNA glycosylase YcaQ family protein [Myxococcaceae bacterium]